MRLLVFLEHHEGRLQKDSLGLLSKASSLGDAEAVILGSGVNELAGEAGKYGAQRVHVDDDVLLDKPLPQPRVDALETLLGDQQFDAGRIECHAVGAPVLGRPQHRPARSLHQRTGEADGGVGEVDVGPAQG